MNKHDTNDREVHKLLHTIFPSFCILIELLCYSLLSEAIPWVIPDELVGLTSGFIFLSAAVLYWYSDKGKKNMYSWPALSIITCILVSVFEKLAS